MITSGSGSAVRAQYRGQKVSLANDTFWLRTCRKHTVLRRRIVLIKNNLLICRDLLSYNVKPNALCKHLAALGHIPEQVLVKQWRVFVHLRRLQGELKRTSMTGMTSFR